MISRKSVSGIAAVAVALLMTAACGSDDSSDSAASTSEHTHPMRSSLAATASSAVRSGLNTAQQVIQDAINAALAAAPITFDSGSSDLSGTDVATIKAVAVPLKGNDAEVEITTYAEAANSATAESLAKSRGDNIAAELEAAGVDKSRITVKPEGNPSGEDVKVDEAKIEVVGD
ncbi:OmpA family protein [Nocardia niwae]|uniref:OmpA family protein n=1 Tax=Nocardia niwae TaxID=626084 RepID=A0ABV2XGW8_9NOCA|nr:OmpA family protein [Nocardia niwae]